MCIRDRIPGVSTRTTCASPASTRPRTGPRVVWALWVTIDTLAPTRALVRVDLPLLGAPIRATKPQRVFSLAVSVIGSRPPHAFAHEHGESSRLLGFPLVRALASLCFDAFHLHLRRKPWRMVRPFAGDLHVTGQRELLALRPFL